MSHVTKIDVKIHDLDALREACEVLGLDFREGQATYAWWGTFVGDSHAYGDHDPKDFGKKAAHAIGRAGTTPSMGASGEWEIGVVPSKDGNGFDLLADTYGGPGGKLLAACGPNMNRLRQEYATAVASRRAHAKLSREGFSTKRVELPGGWVRLKVRRR